jgi:predicted amidohydrolase
VAIEDIFEIIHDRDFRPIDLQKAFEEMHLYAGHEAAQEFDLASQLLQVVASRKIHHLVQNSISKKVNLNLKKPFIISTFHSGRVLAPDPRAPPEQHRQFRFALGTRGGRTRGLTVNPNADPGSRYDRNDQARWIAENQNAINRALSKGADIVCLGEFDFPPVDPNREAESSAANEKYRRWITSRLVRGGRPAIVFAGSSHQWQEAGCTNIGETFIAEPNHEGKIVVRHLRYEKRIAAKNQGEILLETMPIHPYFATSLGKVAVLICMEAFDPAMVMSVFANSSSYNRLDVILVPSYNRSRKLLRSCQQLSSLANCIVVYVNALGIARHDKAQVYLSGVSLGTWREQLQYVKAMVLSKKRLDRRMFESIPGVRNLRKLIHLASIGRDIQIKDIGPGPELKSWAIPLGFAAEAAGVMRTKHPVNRGRIIASLSLFAEEPSPFRFTPPPV